jgi:hypothetical protein
MAPIDNILLLAASDAVTVVFDVRFLLVCTLGVSLVVPMLGALFLGLWCRVLNTPVSKYLYRAMAYWVGYILALTVALLMMFLVKDSTNVPGWFLASLFGQALAIHGLVVPLILKTPWGKGIAAQGLALVLYGAVLVIAVAPVIIHVRRAVDRAEWTADINQLYQTITSGKGVNVAELPATLEAVELGGEKILLLPGHQRRDMIYLGDYVLDNYPAMLGDRFVGSMLRFRAERPGVAPLIWRNPRTAPGPRITVCDYNGSVSYMTPLEFEHHLERTLLDLNKFEPKTTTTAPQSD